MPAINETTWRQTRAAKGYLRVYKPPVVFAASVNQTAFVYPLASLTFDTVTTGAYTDVVVGQLVKFMDASGNFKQWGRVRATPTSSILYIGHVSDGELSLADNDTFEVLNDFRPFSRIPTISQSGVEKKDYNLAWTDETNKIPPKCNGGPFVAGFIDPDTLVLSVDFDLTNSYAVAYGATLGATPYSGSVVDGTVVSGTIASGVFTAEFPAGERWCSFTVTDSNSKTHTCRVYVYAAERTGDNAPLNAVAESLEFDREGGSFRFRVLADDQTKETLQPGALVVFFMEETYGGSAGSLGNYAGRENVKFVGWLLENSLSIDPNKDTLVFTAESITYYAKHLPAFSRRLTHKTTATNWSEVKYLSLFRLIDYMLRWHSNLLELADLEKPSWNTTYAALPGLDTDEASLFEQVNNAAKAVEAVFGSDFNGRMYVRQNPQLMSDASRADVDTTLALQTSDYNFIGLTQRHRQQDYWLRGSALLASYGAITPFMSISPGDSPSQGERSSTLDRQLVASQADLNVRTGRKYFLENNEVPNARLSVFRGGQVVAPCLFEYVEVNLSASLNRRALSYSDTKFLPLRVSIDLDAETGTGKEEWELEPEVYGVAGKRVIVPVDRVEDYDYGAIPDYIPPVESVIEPIVTPITNLGDSIVYVQDNTVKSILRCRNFGTGVENWEIVFNILDIPSDYFGLPSANVYFPAGFVLDSWNPKNGMYVTTVAADISGNNNDDRVEVWYVGNLNAEPGNQTFTRIYDAIADRTGPFAGVPNQDSSINVNGMFGIVIQEAGFVHHGVLIQRHSLSGAMTRYDWGIQTSETCPWAFGHHAASGVSGKLYVAMGGIPGTIYKSANNGQTISSDHTPSSSRYFMFAHIPYNDNPNDNVAYFGVGGYGNGMLVRRNEDGSYDEVAISFYGGTPNEEVVAIHSYTDDRQYMAVMTLAGAGFGEMIGRSTDGGDTWEKVDLPSGSAYGSLSRFLGGWPYSKEIMVFHSYDGGGYRGIWWTDNFFSAATGADVVWNNAIGDYESVTGASYGGVIHTPVWVG